MARLSTPKLKAIRGSSQGRGTGEYCPPWRDVLLHVDGRHRVYPFVITNLLRLSASLSHYPFLSSSSLLLPPAVQGSAQGIHRLLFRLPKKESQPTQNEARSLGDQGPAGAFSRCCSEHSLLFSTGMRRYSDRSAGKCFLMSPSEHWRSTQSNAKHTVPCS